MAPAAVLYELAHFDNSGILSLKSMYELRNCENEPKSYRRTEGLDSNFHLCDMGAAARSRPRLRRRVYTRRTVRRRRRDRRRRDTIARVLCADSRTRTSTVRQNAQHGLAGHARWRGAPRRRAIGIMLLLLLLLLLPLLLLGMGELCLAEPWSKLLASDGTPGDSFGYSVALDGEVVVVGAPNGADNAGGGDAGTVYVFARDAGSGAWSEAQKLLASDGSQGDSFGYSVGLDGEVLVVGAPYGADNAGGTQAGAVYVFVRDVGSGAWSEAQKLLASDGSQGDYFGISVGLDGEVLVVGADGADNTGGTQQGAVYVFARDEGSGAWSEAQKLLASDGSRDDYFGISVALDGEVLVVGAHYPPGVGGSDAGTVYVFARDEGSGAWSEAQKLLASDGSHRDASPDFFGISVALDGEVLVVGAHLADNAGGIQQGAVYVFARDEGSGAWSEAQKLLASDGSRKDYFGSRIALDGEVLVVGAYFDDNAGGSNAGSAYILGRCNDFASVSSVVSGSCVSCSGPEVADCIEASCAAGFAGYYSRGRCMACHDFASVSSVESSSCVSCSGPEVADCIEASCAAGFAGYSRGRCCHDFASVSSVESGSCFSCTGPHAADCIEASCAAGFVRYERGGGCWSIAALVGILGGAVVTPVVMFAMCEMYPVVRRRQLANRRRAEERAAREKEAREQATRDAKAAAPTIAFVVLELT
eukprot:COSAG02_NODE_8126_length_2697_cov_7.124326_1_plen_702_part_10